MISEAIYGECPVCGAYKPLTNAGTLNNHGGKWKPKSWVPTSCKGTGQKPVTKTTPKEAA